ncbi:class I SAM-dependent methyltransferase [Novosphingobium umbonatum]|uniref:Class I SAM-dependent methyltransferase n=1 Tax=Novosphingobium umbonatum TaxID=1908524 RepID=A0A437NAN3_9SPHN|nr:class I SAM-dependent methyltransferase [Novosphingobium umbonatum]RVU06979.1 class I SAM-dependent methyltransferase [Novosphingobium umbonatum]
MATLAPETRPNTPHYGHAVMPQATHDEQALEDHFLAMRAWTNQHMDPLDRRLLDEVIVPEVTAKTGKAPTRSGEVRGALESHPLHQYWLTLSLFYQDRIWHVIDDAIDRQYDDLAGKVAELSAQPKGSLRLNPDLEMPRYISSIDHHRMGGGYITDTSEADFRAGALYDRFASTYLRNLNGGWKNDGRGHTLASHVQGFFPDFKPKRILDLGCSVGHSTVAIAQAFPDAEVYALDVGAPMLRYGHARAESMGVGIHFSQQDAEHTDFEDGSFDLVCSSALLHETSAKGMRQIFKESHRLLRSGGIMCHVDVPPRHEHLCLWDQMRCDFESHYNNEPFMTSLARTDWMKVATDAGFAPEKVGIGYRKGTFWLNPNTSDFFTEGHPEGRTLMGSWYACAAVKD